MSVPEPNDDTAPAEMTVSHALMLINQHLRLDQIEEKQRMHENELALAEEFMHNLTHQAMLDHAEYTRLCDAEKELAGYERLFGEKWPLSAEEILEKKPEYQRIIDNFIKKSVKK